jgi:hypothetical protein
MNVLQMIFPDQSEVSISGALAIKRARVGVWALLSF